MSNPVPDLAAQLASIRKQLAALSQQVAALSEQHKQLQALVAVTLPGPAETRGPEPGEPASGPPAREILARCRQDILRLLRDLGRPLTTLEILDELVHRRLSWRESTVSHALAELIDQGLVRGSQDGGPRRHGLAIAPETIETI
jgi:hypothetical protein